MGYICVYLGIVLGTCRVSMYLTDGFKSLGLLMKANRVSKDSILFWGLFWGLHVKLIVSCSCRNLVCFKSIRLGKEAALLDASGDKTGACPGLLNMLVKCANLTAQSRTDNTEKPLAKKKTYAMLDFMACLNFPCY